MSVLKSEDSAKWINAFLAILGVLAGFIVSRFLIQMGEWFDLEAKISHFTWVVQGGSIALGFLTFIILRTHNGVSKHLNEVYAELLKVVWPDNESVVKSTIGIIIGISILSGLFISVDYAFRSLLELIY